MMAERPKESHRSAQRERRPALIVSSSRYPSGRLKGLEGVRSVAGLGMADMNGIN